jgi:hypothetical protein
VGTTAFNLFGILACRLIVLRNLRKMHLSPTFAKTAKVGHPPVMLALFSSHIRAAKSKLVEQLLEARIPAQRISQRLSG